MKQTRQERINSEIRKELSDILSNKINDPRVKGIISVPSVEISSDLSHCKINLSIFSGDKAQDDKTFEAISSMSGFIRKELAKKVDLRIMPELLFRQYKGFEENEKINKLIEKLNKTSEE
ncbi:MAG: 30S ribosome-binding factor RbfA [Clostridia bacterium]|nr:30S ribosome-binding factor RbfA [Clostridia bacterium]